MKIIIIGTLVTIVLILGGAILVSNFKPEEAVTNQVEGIEAKPDSYDIGNVPINGGLVYKEYEVKNVTGKTIKLKKVATSCMCTKAKVKKGDYETSQFSMEGMGDKNPSINLEVGAGDSVKVTAIFDPAAHGPQGIGPIDRAVILTFSDPVGIKELKFNGVVVN